MHVPLEYDYRFETKKREQIIDLLKRLWFNIHGENMPLFGIPKPHKDLRDFTTTEKDMKRKQSRHPTNDYRLLAEDIFEVSGPSSGSVEQKMNAMNLEP